MYKEYTLDFQQVAANPEKLVMMPYIQEDMAGHDHHFFELVYITGGTAIHLLNDRKSKVSSGDYFIIDYGSVHSYQESNNLSLINCLFLPEIIDDTLQDCHSFDALVQACLIRYYTPTLRHASADRIFHDSDGHILSLLTGMQKEYQEKKAGYTEIFRCRLIELLIFTLRDMLSVSRTIPVNSTIQNLLSFIEQHYFEPITLSMFCEQHHFSLQYMSRKFKQEIGIPFREYLQKTRIEKSCKLLVGSDLRISEIAQTVGYNDLKFFQQSFHKFLKMSPREYRKLSFSSCNNPSVTASAYRWKE